ncbi:MAG: ABC transporter permease [Phycisphaerales bacterium]|nr:ABC transporter permease [Phycisphaerales bacterium]
MLGIVFGVAAVVSMLAVIEGAKSDILDRLSRLGTNVLFVLHQEDENDQTRSLQLKDAVKLRKASSSIEAVAGASVVERSLNQQVVGVTPEYFQVRQLTLQSGRVLSDLDVQNQAHVCVIGKDVTHENGKHAGVGDVLHLAPEMYKVVGVLASEESVKDQSLSSLLRNHNSMVLIPVTSSPSSVGLLRDEISLTELSIRTTRADEIVTVREVVDRSLQQGQGSKPSYDVVLPRQLLREEQQAQRVFAVVVGCVALIGVLVGGIGVMNIMLANVAERCKEIGIRRAIGATKKQIALQFLFESMLLTSIGGIGGLAIGVCASIGISQFGGWSVTITPWSLLLALAMAGVVGLLAGWYPSRRAAALDPVDAMRRE